MNNKLDDHASSWTGNSDALKSWIMVLLTLLFVVLYGAALIGWLRPLSDERMAIRLEPIILVIIGYYFGRLPSQQNEQNLKNEIERHAQRADGAQHAKEQAQKSGEVLEEKLKNVRTTLAAHAPANLTRAFVEKPGNSANEEALRRSISAALNILDS